MDSEAQSKLVSLIFRLMSLNSGMDPMDWESGFVSLISQITSLVNSMDLNSEPESELIILITEFISFLHSMDLDVEPKPLSELVSLITQTISFINSTNWYTKPKPEVKFRSLTTQIFSLEPEPELISIIRQIFSVVISAKSDSKRKPEKFISLCPQVEVKLEQGKFCVMGKVENNSTSNRDCLPGDPFEFRSTGLEATPFFCPSCNGKYHRQYKKAPVEIKHPLHPKHSLQLVKVGMRERTRECYCCDEVLLQVFYYCSTCDYAMNIACVGKPPLLSAIDHSKWHNHTLAMFPRQASLTCYVCALSHSNCPFYMCPPCDFVVHQSCLNLPRVIKISRHFHRISFTPSFDQGEWSCSICRRKVNNDYGGYWCIKNGCAYAAHSKCATQSNVWDGIDLEGEPEEAEEEVGEPYVRISDGVIQHFSHQHQLTLDKNTDRDYDENMLCQACMMPIYFGNFYSSMQRDFILHEVCANLPRKMHNPIHPHLLTLVGGNNGVINEGKTCSACPWLCTTGFFYECGKEECDFQLHVQCATISEPLVHGSHKLPLFLTSKPGDRRVCCVCKDSEDAHKEKFNCIESDFSLCFGCATLPQNVRYKHDKHMLTLSYGEETSTKTYWCEVCEKNISPKERFYKCDEYCCVTLHIECLIGKDLYMKPGLLYFIEGKKVGLLSNNQHMCRPICSSCKERCRYRICFRYSGLSFCSDICMFRGIIRGLTK